MYGKNKKLNYIIKSGSVILSVIALGLVAWLVYRHYHNHKTNRQAPAPTGIGSQSQSVSQQPTIQPNQVREGSSKSEPGVQATTNPKDWSVSQGGKITLQTPINGAKFASGNKVIGLARATPIQYRLVDNSAGVISQGPINVINGKFSVSLSFQSYGNGAHLDIFSLGPGGLEQNEVRVNLKY